MIFLNVNLDSLHCMQKFEDTIQVAFVLDLIIKEDLNLNMNFELGLHCNYTIASIVTLVVSHVLYDSRSNKRHKMLTFEVANFDMGYNCILGRTFLTKFMVVIHTAYAIRKLPDPKGIITIKSNIKDVFACDIGMLTKAGHFSE
jgi:hypothetical protein